MRAARSWIVLMVALLVATVGACGGAAEPFGRPADLGDGWETATLEEVGLEAEPFRDLVEVAEDEPARAVHGILVVRDGRLVFEQYFAGYRFDYDAPGFRGEAVEYDATNRHNLMSITKAVTGAVVGIAVDDGEQLIDGATSGGALLRTLLLLP